MISIPHYINFTEEDGDMVIYNLKTDRFFGLDGVGGFIWKKINEIKDEDQIIDLVTKEFDIPYTTAKIDFYELIEALKINGLVIKDVEN